MTANRQGFVHPGLIILIKSGHYLITDKRMPSLPIVAASSGFSLSMTNSLLPDARYTIDYVHLANRELCLKHILMEGKKAYISGIISISFSLCPDPQIRRWWFNKNSSWANIGKGIAVTRRSLMCHWLIIDTGKKSIRARNKMFCFRETARVNSWVH